MCPRALWDRDWCGFGSWSCPLSGFLGGNQNLAWRRRLGLSWRFPGRRAPRGCRGQGASGDLGWGRGHGLSASVLEPDGGPAQAGAGLLLVLRQPQLLQRFPACFPLLLHGGRGGAGVPGRSLGAAAGQPVLGVAVETAAAALQDNVWRQLPGLRGRDGGRPAIGMAPRRDGRISSACIPRGHQGFPGWAFLTGFLGHGLWSWLPVSLGAE